jgi:ubiquinone/menaquinone biosynthesis C-methylase UbiE
MKDVLRHWSHYGIKPGRCIEVGCGAGRMTGGLLNAFSSVLALDVSSDQIAVAKSHHATLLDKIEFQVITTSKVPAEAESCSGMFSCHVFQHFSDFSGIVAYLRETYRVLCQGGTICFHLPQTGANTVRELPSLLLGLRNAFAKLKRVVGNGRAWEYHRYRPGIIFGILKEIGFNDIEVRVFPMLSNGDFHTYYFARKL